MARDRDVAAQFRKSPAILNICLAASASPNDLGEALDLFEDAFAAALAKVRKEENEACAGVLDSYVAHSHVAAEVVSDLASEIRARQAPTGTGESRG